MRKRIIITAAPIVFFLTAGLFLFRHSLQPPVHLKRAPKNIEIARGTGFEDIAVLLKNENFIRSELIFKIYALMSGRARRLNPGRYTVDRPLSVPEIIEMIADGPSDVLVTIVPGMTVKEIDDKLSALGVIKDGEFDSEPEGFFPPDTYYFSPAMSREDAVKKFSENFEKKALPFFKNRDNFLKILTVASLLEKEIPVYEEQRIAAGILEKRLAAGMPLQIDATIVYVKCRGRFLNCPPLTKTDYEIDSPYNTYLYAGLPPAPISNPSIQSIRAAINPVKSEYWYYLSDPKTKKTIFSKILDEHNENRAKFLLRNNNPPS